MIIQEENIVLSMIVVYLNISFLGWVVVLF